MSELDKRLEGLSPEKRALFEQRLKQKTQEKVQVRETIPKRTSKGPAKASLDQKSLWFFHQIDPQSIAYNLGFGQRLRGPFVHDIMERALNEMVRRHESLRTTFHYIDDELYQVVAPSMTASMPVHDLRHVDPEIRDVEVQKLATRLFHTPFDLEKGPLFRFPIVRVTDTDFVYLISMHHAITDWWSVKLFNTEFVMIFYAFTKGLPSPLPMPVIQFTDYSEFRNKWLGGPDFQRQLDYWINRLDGAPLVLELPADKPRPPRPTYVGKRFSYGFLGKHVHDGIRAANMRNKATSLMTTLAAGYAFIYRYAHVNDILIGTSTAGREYKELEKMMGFILNILVLRCKLDDSTTFDQLVTQVRQTVLGAFAHKDLPFRYLVEKLSPERELSRMPIYQVDFNHVFNEGPVFEGYSGVAPEEYIEGYENVPFVLDRGVSDVDLQINFTEFHDNTFLMLELNMDIFELATGYRMGGLMHRLVAGMVAQPNTPISKIDWLSQVERDELLISFNDVAYGYPQEQSVAALFQVQAQQRPNAAAVIGEDSIMTYGELEKRANQLAHYLIGQGVAPGATVGLCLERGHEWVITMLAAFKIGAVYVPLDPEYPSDRLAYMIGDTQMNALISTNDLVDRLPSQELNFLNLILLDEIASELASGNDTAPNRNIPADALAYIIYTSGTTGRPKGVMVCHRSINRLVFDTVYVKTGPEDVVACASNTAFDAHLFEVWTALLHGARLCLISRQTLLDINALAERFDSCGVTHLFIPVSLFNQYISDRPTVFSRLKYVLFGGERADAETVRHVQAAGGPAKLYNVYGPTETTTFASWHDLAGLAPTVEKVPIGGPIGNTFLYVTDPRLNLLPKGSIGELVIGGPGLAFGYLGAPTLTATRFIPNPFRQEAGGRLYRTGDLVSRNNDGHICFEGRIDKQVKLRGFRIELGEIEAALCRSEAVAEAHVIVQKHPNGTTRRLIGYVCGNERSVAMDIPSLRHYIGQLLPDYMVPSVIIALDRFPLTPNGKLDVSALPDPDQTETKEAAVAPTNDVEALLVEVWSEILNLESPIGIHDNFFERGGDSIMAIQAVAAANRRGLQMSTRDLFQHQTISALAPFANQARKIDAQQSTLEGDALLTPIQAWFLGLKKFPHHFNIPTLATPAQALKPEILQETLETLALHHDGLRMRFVPDGSGWRQFYDNSGGPHFPLEQVELPGASFNPHSIETYCTRVQGSLDLQSGPVARAVLFSEPTSGQQRLFITIHHLVFDGISTRVVFEDLQTVYSSLLEGKKPKLPAKTTSWKAWAERLHQLARSERILKQLPYWRNLVTSPWAYVPPDRDVANDGRTKNMYETHFDVAETRTLLREIPSVYNTGINDLLLASLAMAIGRVTGNYSIRVSLEGHGREDIFDDVDISRTIGWFTCMYPIILTANHTEPGMIIKDIKEQLRSIPMMGLGYGLLRYCNPETAPELAAMPVPQLNLNYLGSFDEGAGGSASLLQVCEDPCGPEHCPEDPRHHDFEIVGAEFGGKLSLAWQYCESRFNPETIERLAKAHVEALRELIAHCTSEGAGGRTPSDFPLAGLDQPLVDKILSLYPNLEDVYPATQLQQGMLFHSSFTEGTKMYYDSLTMKLTGDLDPDLFLAAWQATMDANPVLRTGFHVGVRGVYQVVLKQTALNVKRITGEEETDEPIRPAIDQPPFELHLVSYGNNHWKVSFVFHHASLDGWSVPLVLDEVIRRYKASVSGIAPNLPKRAAYRTYMQWLTSRDFDQARGFWRNALAGFTSPNVLIPPHRGRTEELTERTCGADGFFLSIEETSRLASLVVGTTLNTLVEAAWTLLVARHSGQSDVVFCTISSGRPAELPDVEGLIGMLVATLPLRMNSQDPRPLRELLVAIQEKQLDARQYEYLSFPEIQGLAEIPHGEQLSHSLTVFENYPVSASVKDNWNTFKVEVVDNNEYASYPLTLVAHGGSELIISLRYESNLFTSDEVRTILAHLRHILVSMPAYIDQPLHAIPLFTPEERNARIQMGSNTASVYPRDRTPEALFVSQVMAQPHAPALHVGDQTLSYGQVGERVAVIAQELAKKGVGPGSVVGISLRQEDPDYLHSILAVASRGATYLPMDVTWPSERRRHILAESKPVLILTHPDLPSGAQEPQHLDPRSITASAPPLSVVPVPPEAPLYIMYTSGSTGKPKGVVVPRRAVVRLVCNNHFLEIKSSDVLLMASIPSFDASTFEIWGALLNGASLVPVDMENLERIAQRGVTLAWFTAQLFNLMVDSQLNLLSGLRCVLTGGDIVSPEHVRRLKAAHPQITVLNGYGPTEGTTFTCSGPIDADVGDRASIGKPLSNTTVYILDSDLEPSVSAGELMIGGDGLALGYLQAPALTAEKFIPNPFAVEPGERLYRSGDRAAFLADGRVDFLGRIDRQVKLRGFRIEPGEVETAVRRLPQVADAHIAVRVLGGDKKLVAFIASSAASDQIAVWRDALKDELPEYMVPSHWVILERLPVTANGKLDKRELYARENEGTDAFRAPYVAPRTPTEEAIVAAWCQVLDIDKMGINDNFFELGGHSLLVTRVATRLSESLGLTLSLKAIYDAPTAEKLAAYIDVLNWARAPEQESAGEDEEEGEL